MQLLGVNCLRVPFSFQALFSVAPSSKTVQCNPSSQADVRANVIPPGVNVPANIPLPGLVSPQPCFSFIFIYFIYNYSHVYVHSLVCWGQADPIGYSAAVKAGEI